MAKGTVIFLSILAVIALLLLGINIGKKISTPSSVSVAPTLYNSQPTVYVPSPTVAPTVANQSPITDNQSMSTFTDSSCGYSFSYPGSFMRQETVNKKSVIYVDPKNPKIVIAATCETTLPRPPLSPDKQETVTLGGTTGTLYHDTDTNGNPRDEIFVKHPTNGMEIVIAGYGEIFQTIRSTFKFVQ